MYVHIPRLGPHLLRTHPRVNLCQVCVRVGVSVCVCCLYYVSVKYNSNESENAH